MIRQSVSTGLLDKDSIDTHVLTAAEHDIVRTQLRLATMIKELYEALGGLGRDRW